jgi:Gpi18-like mannosyltransferase
MKNKEIIKKILLLFLSWRISLLIITAIGINLIPFIIQPGYELQKISSNTEYWIRWANWDGGHFLSIAKNGYTETQTVFFPLYPLLIKTLTFFGLNYFWSGFIISQIATAFVLFFFYKLILLDYKKEIVETSILLLLIFPASFYLSAVYSESLFLALTMASFYFARQKKWFLASLLASLSAITRLFGLIVILAIAIEYFLPHKIEIKLKNILGKKEVRIALYLIAVRIISIFFLSPLHQINELFSGIIITLLNYLDFVILLVLLFLIFKFLLLNYKSVSIFFKEKVFNISVLWIVLSTIPFFTYLLYQQIQFNNPVAFITSESEWNRHITSPFYIGSYYLQYFFSKNLFSLQFWSLVNLEITFILILIITFIKSIFNLRYSYVIYFLFTLLIPISSGTSAAILRYALIIFPFFIVLATIKDKNILFIWKLISTCLLALFSIMYINAYWIT